MNLIKKIECYKNQVADISNNHEVDITPAGPTFATWGLIYTWQFAWLIFNLVILFQKNTDGNYYYNTPLVLNVAFQILIFCNFILNIVVF